MYFAELSCLLMLIHARFQAKIQEIAAAAPSPRHRHSGKTVTIAADDQMEY
jgi:hypothetical protein